MSELAKALTDLQAHLPQIVKGETAEVPTKSGSKYTYTYADLASISEQLLPLLTKHGLSFVACPHLRDDGQFVLRYSLMHTSGDERTGDYPLPLQGGPQAQGSAITYARRYVLCAVTGVAPEDDDGQAAQKATEKPDLSELESLIVTAQDMSIEKDWAKTREYASQSEAHLGKAVEKVRQLIADVGADA